MTKADYEKAKTFIDAQGIPFKYFMYNSWCALNIQESGITVEILDDLYVGLVSGVMYNLGRGKTPMRMEGIGPNPEDRFSNESYNKVFDELSYFTSQAVSIDSWEKICPESKWPELMEAHMEWEKISPEERLSNLRNTLIKKYTRK